MYPCGAACTSDSRPMLTVCKACPTALLRLSICVTAKESRVSSYRAVILAAGFGNRMGDLGLHYPKALLPVGDAPVIGHQLKMLRRLGIQSASVIVGHRAADIAQLLGDGSNFGVKLTY